MTITEHFICGKHTAADCEDGIVITNDFAAVIDGSTSKTPTRLDPPMKNGRFAMLLISEYIKQMPADYTMSDFCRGITLRIAEEYNKRSIAERMAEHPEDFDPRAYLKPARAAVKAMVAHKIVDVLGCDGKAF